MKKLKWDVPKVLLEKQKYYEATIEYLKRHGFRKTLSSLILDFAQVRGVQYQLIEEVNHYKDQVEELKEINKIQQHGFSKRIEALEKNAKK